MNIEQFRCLWFSPMKVDGDTYVKFLASIEEIS